MHTHHYKTWGEAAGLPETSARLARLPEGLNFPESFPEPMRYDEKRKRLVYRGFMASTSYRFLHGLSTDSDYVTALDELFESSAYTLDGPGAFGRAWKWLLGVGGAAAAVLGVWTFLR
jgi:hypothetical protein